MKKYYYWLKLKNNFYETNEIDYLMSLKNGSMYVVIFQMLLLKSINTRGALVSIINGVYVSFTTDKIVRECKYFTSEVINEALNMFLKVGLMTFINDGSYYQINNFDTYIGYDTNYALYKRNQREKGRK